MDEITNEQSIESSAKEEWRPTPHMIVFVDTAIRLGSDNVAEITREAGIDESTYYKWIKQPEFNKWMDEYWDKALKSNSWKLDMIGIKNAKRDFNFWKAMQQRAGRLEEKPSVNIDQRKITIVDGSEDE